MCLFANEIVRDQEFMVKWAKPSVLRSGENALPNQTLTIKKTLRYRTSPPLLGVVEYEGGLNKDPSLNASFFELIVHSPNLDPSKLLDGYR